MAEGGYDPDDVFQNTMKHSGFDDDDDQEPLSTTQPFQPGEAPTLYHRGERWEMQTMRQQEQTGLPSYEETSFGGDDERTPLLTDEYIQERLARLRRDSNTGILDLSGITVPKENPLSSGDQNERKERAIRFIKSRYPHLNEKALVIGFSKKNPLMLVVKGPRGGETQIFLKNGSDFQQSFLEKTYVKNALGRPAESVIKQTSDDIRKMQKKRDELRQD